MSTKRRNFDREVDAMERRGPVGRVRGVGDDGRASFEEFYAATYPRLVGGLVVVAGERALAEDAVQEAFVRLIPRWRKVARYDEPAAWVRRVAFNVILDRRRAARRSLRVWRTSAPDSYEDRYPSDDGFEMAIADLSPEQRQVLVLRLVLDCPIEQIATELGVSAGTVKSRLSRARTAVEQRLRNARNHA